jgi:hypothetical protein
MIALWNVSRREGEMMISFKGAHVAQELMLTCVRWSIDKYWLEFQTDPLRYGVVATLKGSLQARA